MITVFILTFKYQLLTVLVPNMFGLTRALEGEICPPLRFFADTGKTAARSTATFQYLLTIE